MKDKQDNNPCYVNSNDWKINNWVMKTLFVVGSISGVYFVVAFMVGVIQGLFNL